MEDNRISGAGEIGVTEKTGVTNAAGDAGAAGSASDAGDAGAAGSASDASDAGAAGSASDAGDAGAAGMSGVTGEELFRRYHEGDNGAFEELVALYNVELFHYINNIVRDYHEARHLTVESFAQLALKGGRFAHKSSIKTYLFAIGKHLAVRYVKMRGRENYVSFENAIELLTDEGETPEEYMDRETDKKLLHEAINDLKEEYRIVLALLYFQDMSYLEAGRVMYKNVRQIEGLARRAKAALKKRLECYGYAA